MVGKFEEDYFDELRAIEQAIVTTYREKPDLVDFQVEKVLEGLIREYTAIVNVKRPPKLRWKPVEQALYDRLKQTCELLLGHDPDVPVGEDRVTEDEVVACLKRIRRSINLMGDKNRRGYLDFIKNYFAD